MSAETVMVRLLKARGGNPQGTIITVSQGAAEMLITRGDAALITKA